MIQLTAEKREAFGKSLKKHRADGQLPVVVYGRKEESKPFFVVARDFKKALSQAGESSIVTLKTDEGVKDVLIYGVDYHPVSGEPIHADFYAVEKGKPVEVAVALEFEGVPPAVKELGGNLIKVLHEVQIEALPKDLPQGLVVDVSKLATLESQILARDLVLPAGVTLITGEEEVVASISAGGEEVTEETPVDISAVEVEKKGKAEEATEETAE
jgi:large subunit ribosomal protein L25